MTGSLAPLGPTPGLTHGTPTRRGTEVRLGAARASVAPAGLQFVQPGVSRRDTPWGRG